MNYLVAAAIGIVAYVLHVWRNQLRFEMPPDAITYNHMAKGGAAPNPFRLRWLVPYLIGDRQQVWQISYALAMVATCPLMAWFAELNGVNGLLAVALWVALPAWSIMARWLNVIDPYAWVIALLTACLSISGYPVAAFIAACVAGMVAPKAVVFALLWTFDPWLAVGLIPVIICQLTAKRGEPLMHPEVIKQPWLYSMMKNGPYLHDAKMLILPWGACLVGIIHLPLLAIPALLIAYSQLFRAIDVSRLYMWAAPVVLVATVQHIPAEWMAVAILATWFNSWRPRV